MAPQPGSYWMTPDSTEWLLRADLANGSLARGKARLPVPVVAAVIGLGC